MTVRLVGIGPGHPGLVTLQARDAIAHADAIRHPENCPSSLLALARPGADVSAFRSNAEVVKTGRRLASVAVLYFGDPYFFSGGAGLAMELERAGLDFEVMPGLPPETAAPALSGIPLTAHGEATSVLLGRPQGAESIVLRLAPGLWDTGVKALIDAGQHPERQAAFIVNPGAPGQRRLMAPLGQLLEVARRRGLEGDALLVMGPGVEMSTLLDTLARRPLHGRRVLVTRARHQVEGFRRELSELGAIVVEVPTIEIRPIEGGDDARAAVEKLPETRLLVFTSANAVDIFFRILFAHRADARSLAGSKICAIGPETAKALEAHGVRPELIAGEYTAEGLAAALSDWDVAGARILVPRARMGRDALPALLRQRGAQVQILPVYETVCPPTSAEELRRLFAGEGVDVITFTSSSTVAHFLDAFPHGRPPDSVGKAMVACMGPVTADTATKLGLRVDIIAREYTTRGLAAAIADSLTGDEPTAPAAR